jgi:hypothetical protein
MAYYIIDMGQELMESFQAKFSSLLPATWIKGREFLSTHQDGLDSKGVYFVALKPGDEGVDDLILEIRHSLKEPKIVYVTSENLDKEFLNSHKLTPVGGDGYISLEASGEQLGQLLKRLGSDAGDIKLIHSARSGGMVQISVSKDLEQMQQHPQSIEIDKLFQQVFKKSSKAEYQKESNLSTTQHTEDSVPGEAMSDKDQELSLEDLGELELGGSDSLDVPSADEDGLELNLDDQDLSLEGDLSFGLDSQEVTEGEGEITLSLTEEDIEQSPDQDLGLELGLDEGALAELDFGAPEEELALDEDGSSLDFDAEKINEDISDDARKKLEEIDAIMVSDSSQVGIELSSDELLGDLSLAENEDLASGIEMTNTLGIDPSLIPERLDVADISFGGNEQAEVTETETEANSPQQSTPQPPPAVVVKTVEKNNDRDFREVAGAYTAEMERMQATISNLRSDREELLAKIQKLEEDTLIQNRQNLTLRAELDERKIELSIMRKKLNDEITVLRDRIQLQDERKIILEEKNKNLLTELDKANQKNKIDIKKVQMRERELEQKLELLKADTEVQIRNRDQKILELKRKIDTMEFDMESISMQEKRSVESRFELEDKLDKAIKTLKVAISTLEEENDKSSVLDRIKKNINM